MADDKTRELWVEATNYLTMTKKALGGRIREARNERKLTLAALGQILGKASQSVQQWEVGAAEPDLEQLHKIIVALGVEAPWLLTGAVTHVDEGWLRRCRENKKLVEQGLEPEEQEGWEFDTAEARSFSTQPRAANKKVRGRIVPVLAVGDATLLVTDDQAVEAPMSHVCTHFDCGADSYAFEVTDSRNEPTFARGDLVIIDPARRCTPASMVLARKGSETVFGRLRVDEHGDALVLAENSAWPPLKLGAFRAVVVERGQASNQGAILGVMTEHTKRAD